MGGDAGSDCARAEQEGKAPPSRGRGGFGWSENGVLNSVSRCGSNREREREREREKQRGKAQQIREGSSE